MPKPYPPQFRRHALDPVASGRTVREVAASLGIAESCLYGWKSRDLIDRGLGPGPSTAESVALTAARRRIADLEAEVKILRKPAAAVEEVVRATCGTAWSPSWPVRASDVVHACRSLGVSRSGFYEARTRAPSARAIRHVWLTDVIAAVHEASRQTYGGRRVHDELIQAHGSPSATTPSACSCAALAWPGLRCAAEGSGSRPRSP